VLEASGGANGLAVLDARPDIRLLFTDFGRFGMNGRELADTARSDLKVVLTSGYARTAIVDLGGLEHGVHLLSKPIRIESLARSLRSALDAA
jgi:CheY-like chemotaxis protein